MEFYQTKMGHQFFENHLPRLIKAVDKIASMLEKPPATQLPVSIQSRPGILKDFYDGYLQPAEDSRLTQNPEYISLTEQLEECSQKLGAAICPADRELVGTYHQLLIDRNCIEVEEAFQTGFRTAVQLIAAGLACPEKEKPNEV